MAYQEWLQHQSKVERSEAATALALRKPQLAQAQAQLEASMAMLEKARTDLDRTSIRAPYRGILRTTNADLGQYVSPGQELAVIFAVDYAEVRLPLTEADLAFIDIPSPDSRIAIDHDRPVVEMTANLGGQSLVRSGHLVRSEGFFDEKTRVIYGVVQLEDPYQFDLPGDQRLSPFPVGTFVSAQINGRLIPGLSVVPAYLLRPGNKIWIVENGLLRDREIQVLALQGNEAYIQRGLEDGMLVSLVRQANAFSGMRVEPILSPGAESEQGPLPAQQDSSGNTANSQGQAVPAP